MNGSIVLTFECRSSRGSERVCLKPGPLIVAGWTGRDDAAVRHHIAELAAIGVPPPSSVPVFYRVAAGNLTQASQIEVLGTDTSGEVEPILVALEDGLWLGLGSDHTDRKAERMGIAVSKQLCEKPIGTSLWRFEDVAGHWDRLQLRALATIEGRRQVYQEGSLAEMRHPTDLLARLQHGETLPSGTIMFCGTLGAMGGIRPATRFEMMLEDPVLGRTIEHAYEIVPLPIIS